MTKNMGSIDKIIRIVVALVVAVLYFTGTVTGVLGYVLLAAGAIFLLTSVVNFCPLYTLLGIKTTKKES
jgi:Inner membrane protein YgaP-like, transmembrane domain